MRVIAYLRVSTERQAEEGLGLEVQEQAIRAWARANSHRIVGWYRDEGVSGSNGIETRLGLADALEALRAGEGKGLVVYRLDRLARDLIIQEQLLADVRRLGADVMSTSAAESGYLADDPDDPSRKLIRQILGAVSEYERGMISLRLRSGRRRKADNGGFAFGAPPFGTYAVGGVLVENDEEQRTVERIVSLHRDGRSLREIGATLDAEGHRPRRASTWHPAVLRRILQRAR
jgi:DNA invertase Pin-like site-specific DNA recombinase